MGKRQRNDISYQQKSTPKEKGVHTYKNKLHNLHTQYITKNYASKCEENM